MEGRISYEFSARLWQYSPTGAWHFISLPKEMAGEIRTHLKWQEEGWGRMKATALIGTSEWKTAIWFDTKLQTYLLPVKTSIRLKENLCQNDEVRVQIRI